MNILAELKKDKVQFLFTLLALNAAVILLVVSFFSGNKAFAVPDLKMYENELNQTAVSSDDLASRLERGERSFLLTQVMSEEDYAYAKPIKSGFFLDAADLADGRSFRKSLPFISVPLIVMGKNTQESLEYAKLLKYYGYQNVRYVTGGYEEFVKDILTRPEDLAVGTQDEKKAHDRKMSRYYYFMGGDPNLGAETKAAPASSGGGGIAAAEGC